MPRNHVLTNPPQISLSTKEASTPKHQGASKQLSFSNAKYYGTLQAVRLLSYKPLKHKESCNQLHTPMEQPPLEVTPPFTSSHHEPREFLIQILSFSRRSAHTHSPHVESLEIISTHLSKSHSRISYWIHN